MAICEAAITRSNSRTSTTLTPPTTTAKKLKRKHVKVSYVAPGDKLEIFDDSRVTSVYIMFERPETEEMLKAEAQQRKTIESKLSQLAFQKVIVLTGNMANSETTSQINGVIKKASNLYDSAREASSSLTKIEILISHLGDYFRGPTANREEGDCALTIPMPNITAIMGRADDILEEERLQNLEINANIEENGDLLAIRQIDGIDSVKLEDQGAALQRTEIAVDRLEKLFQNLEEDLLEKLEMIEAMINGRIPPSILAGMDITLNCIEKGKRDNIHLEVCHQGEKRIICRAELLREGKGIATNRIVSIPYFKDDKTLGLQFDDGLVYKKGTGKTYDVSQCAIVGSQAKCPNLVANANNCLEGLISENKSLAADCSVEKIPDGRPLIVQTELGVLVAQRSDTALVAEYKGEAITENPFIISNSESVGLTFGSEEIDIPAVDLANDNLIIPEGEFEVLAALREIHNWRMKWEKFLPLHLRQILLLFSLCLQAFLTIPLLFRTCDFVMSLCGYETLPKGRRKMSKRYKKRSRRVDLEMGGGGYRPRSPRIKSILQSPRSSISWGSLHLPTDSEIE